MPYRIVVTPEARDQLDELYSYIATQADADIASSYLTALIDQVGTLREFPKRGTARDDLRPGLRTLPWRRRVTIAFVVEERDVIVVGIFYGGRDIEALLIED